MLLSIEDQELSSKDSKCQIGPLLIRDTVGNLIIIPDKLGIMLWQILIQSAPQCNSMEKEWNPIQLNGSDLNNGEKELHQDSSITKSPIQDG
jgi:hypothetical protein